jgi:hypothetical membrane protein
MITSTTTPHESSFRRAGSDETRIAMVAGGLAWLLGAVQYLIAQVVAAGAWHPGYSWSDNYISDLGNTACGSFAVPHGTAMYVCSPRHDIMNASFILSGALFIIGAVLLRRFWPPGSLTHRAFILLVVAGIGKALVGIAPENVNVGLHLLGSLNVLLVSIAILMLSASIRQTRPALSSIGSVLAVMGLAGTILSTFGQFAGTALYLGLGVGGMERIASYPGTLWMMLAAVSALSYAGADA